MCSQFNNTRCFCNSFALGFAGVLDGEAPCRSFFAFDRQALLKPLSFLWLAGYTIKSYPAVFETEFKRPTPLPNKLQAVVSPAAQPPLQCAVLTRDGEKEVIVGRLHSK